MNRPYGHKPAASEDKVIDYRIEKYETIYDLENAVNTGIKAGWLPLGGVCMVKQTTMHQYIQAMVRYSDEN